MSAQKDFSYTKGYSFSFEEEGSKIEAWFSVFSGLEKVFVDGELVSSRRNLSSTNSTQSFQIGENEYSTNLQTVSLLKGPLVCTLSKNGTACKRQKLVFTQKKNTYRDYLYAIAIGGTFGVADIIWKFSIRTWCIAFGALFVIVILYKLTQPGRKPVVEEEIID